MLGSVFRVEPVERCSLMQVRLSGEANGPFVAGGTSSWPSDIQSGNTVAENAVSDWRYPLLLISADSVDNLRNDLSGLIQYSRDINNINNIALTRYYYFFPNNFPDNLHRISLHPRRYILLSNERKLLQAN